MSDTVPRAAYQWYLGGVRGRCAALLLVAGCKSPVFEYTADSFAGAYKVVAKMEQDGREGGSTSTVSFDVQRREDGRFDLYVTELVVEGKAEDRERLAERPIHDFVVDARGPSDARRNPDGFLAHQSGENDLFNTFAFLFPSEPTGALKVGTSWTGTRRVPMAKEVAAEDIEFIYEIVVVEPCEDAQQGTCAAYQFGGSVATGTYAHEYSGEGTFASSGLFDGASAKVIGSGGGRSFHGEIFLQRE